MNERLYMIGLMQYLLLNKLLTEGTHLLLSLKPNKPSQPNPAKVPEKNAFV